ncbi:MAG: hypothetical protein P1U58_09060 [Verrucomicrobiales bacterium]|nr:hypothetical protein [Verrucomicrobiales bacterium]
MKTQSLKTSFAFSIAALLSFCYSDTLKSAEAIVLTLEDLDIKNPAVEVAEDSDLIIKIVAEPGKKKLNPLFEINSPAVTGDSYAIIGEVSCRDVTEKGYLEMWNHIPLVAGETQIGASFFSRTLGTSGPMKVLAGDEEWRPFTLPAMINDGSGRRPLRLTINVNLPNGGTVELRNLRLRPSLGTSPSKIGWIKPVVISVTATAAVFLTIAATIWMKYRKTRKELKRINNLDAI